MCKRSQGSTGVMAGKEELVRFDNVKACYDEDASPITLTYTLGSAVSTTPQDWIGLFPFDQQDTRHPLSFTWTAPKGKPKKKKANSPDKRQVAFSLNDVFKFKPSKDSECFQFVYVSKNGDVCGRSRKFQITGELWLAKENDEFSRLSPLSPTSHFSHDTDSEISILSRSHIGLSATDSPVLVSYSSPGSNSCGYVDGKRDSKVNGTRPHNRDVDDDPDDDGDDLSGYYIASDCGSDDGKGEEKEDLWEITNADKMKEKEDGSGSSFSDLSDIVILSTSPSKEQVQSSPETSGTRNILAEPTSSTLCSPPRGKGHKKSKSQKYDGRTTTFNEVISADTESVEGESTNRTAPESAKKKKKTKKSKKKSKNQSSEESWDLESPVVVPLPCSDPTPPSVLDQLRIVDVAVGHSDDEQNVEEAHDSEFEIYQSRNKKKGKKKQKKLIVEISSNTSIHKMDDESVLEQENNERKWNKKSDKSKFGKEKASVGCPANLEINGSGCGTKGEVFNDVTRKKKRFDHSNENKDKEEVDKQIPDTDQIIEHYKAEKNKQNKSIKSSSQNLNEFPIDKKAMKRKQNMKAQGVERKVTEPIFDDDVDYSTNIKKMADKPTANTLSLPQATGKGRKRSNVIISGVNAFESEAKTKSLPTIISKQSDHSNVEPLVELKYAQSERVGGKTTAADTTTMLSVGNNRSKQVDDGKSRDHNALSGKRGKKKSKNVFEIEEVVNRTVAESSQNTLARGESSIKTVVEVAIVDAPAPMQDFSGGSSAASKRSKKKQKAKDKLKEAAGSEGEICGFQTTQNGVSCKAQSTSPLSCRDDAGESAVKETKPFRESTQALVTKQKDKTVSKINTKSRGMNFDQLSKMVAQNNAQTQSSFGEENDAKTNAADTKDRNRKRQQEAENSHVSRTTKELSRIPILTGTISKGKGSSDKCKTKGNKGNSHESTKTIDEPIKKSNLHDNCSKDTKASSESQLDKPNKNEGESKDEPTPLSVRSNKKLKGKKIEKGVKQALNEKKKNDTETSFAMTDVGDMAASKDDFQRDVFVHSNELKEIRRKYTIRAKEILKARSKAACKSKSERRALARTKRVVNLADWHDEDDDKLDSQSSESKKEAPQKPGNGIAKNDQSIEASPGTSRTSPPLDSPTKAPGKGNKMKGKPTNLVEGKLSKERSTLSAKEGKGLSSSTYTTLDTTDTLSGIANKATKPSIISKLCPTSSVSAVPSSGERPYIPAYLLDVMDALPKTADAPNLRHWRKAMARRKGKMAAMLDNQDSVAASTTAQAGKDAREGVTVPKKVKDILENPQERVVFGDDCFSSNGTGVARSTLCRVADSSLGQPSRMESPLRSYAGVVKTEESGAFLFQSTSKENGSDEINISNENKTIGVDKTQSLKSTSGKSRIYDRKMMSKSKYGNARNSRAGLANYSSTALETQCYLLDKLDAKQQHTRTKMRTDLKLKALKLQKKKQRQLRFYGRLLKDTKNDEIYNLVAGTTFVEGSEDIHIYKKSPSVASPSKDIHALAWPFPESMDGLFTSSTADNSCCLRTKNVEITAVDSEDEIIANDHMGKDDRLCIELSEAIGRPVDDNDNDGEEPWSPIKETTPATDDDGVHDEKSGLKHSGHAIASAGLPQTIGEAHVLIGRLWSQVVSRDRVIHSLENIVNALKEKLKKKAEKTAKAQLQLRATRRKSAQLSGTDARPQDPPSYEKDEQPVVEDAPAYKRRCLDHEACQPPPYYNAQPSKRYYFQTQSHVGNDPRDKESTGNERKYLSAEVHLPSIYQELNELQEEVAAQQPSTESIKHARRKLFHASEKPNNVTVDSQRNAWKSFSNPSSSSKSPQAKSKDSLYFTTGRDAKRNTHLDETVIDEDRECFYWKPQTAFNKQTHENPPPSTLADREHQLPFQHWENDDYFQEQQRRLALSSERVPFFSRKYSMPHNKSHGTERQRDSINQTSFLGKREQRHSESYPHDKHLLQEHMFSVSAEQCNNGVKSHDILRPIPLLLKSPGRNLTSHPSSYQQQNQHNNTYLSSHDCSPHPLSSSFCQCHNVLPKSPAVCSQCSMHQWTECQQSGGPALKCRPSQILGDHPPVFRFCQQDHPFQSESLRGYDCCRSTQSCPTATKKGTASFYRDEDTVGISAINEPNHRGQDNTTQPQRERETKHRGQQTLSHSKWNCRDFY